jgi:hypothetical protein
MRVLVSCTSSHVLVGHVEHEEQRSTLVGRVGFNLVNPGSCEARDSTYCVCMTAMAMKILQKVGLKNLLKKLRLIFNPIRPRGVTIPRDVCASARAFVFRSSILFVDENHVGCICCKAACKIFL